ncbi:MAG TPA: hypothetical protein VID26_10035 [Candidatus Limnocylindrales bacterium]
MPSEALLLGIASIGAVVAGFTAVTAVLQPPGGSWSPALRIRHRSIVSTSFNVMFEALVPLIVFAWLADARSSVIVSSAGVAVYVGWIVALFALALCVQLAVAVVSFYTLVAAAMS